MYLGLMLHKNLDLNITARTVTQSDNRALGLIIIIITLFQEDNIFGRVASLTYGPQLTNVGMIL